MINISNTASGRTVFVLGRELDGNRQAVVVESGQEYDLDPLAIVAYATVTARFPYTIV